MKRFILCIATISMLAAGYAQENADGDSPMVISPYFGAVYNNDGFHDFGGLDLYYEYDDILIAFDLMLVNDDKYDPSEPYMFGHYFQLNDGRVQWTPDNWSFTGGRMIHRDEVDTPYSLFISSMDLPATAFDAEYQNDFIFYNTRWVGLNLNSNLYERYDVVYEDDTPVDFEGNPDELSETDYYIAEPIDRGMNYKAYGLKFGDLRIGLQESIVYVNAYMMPEYFLSPLPMYFSQLVNSTDGKPWTKDSNDNTILGMFVDITKPEYYAYGQLLLDDVNLNALAPGYDLKQPWKTAWSLGGKLNTDWGDWGFYHGGALKYAFASTRVDNHYFADFRYEYAYFPATSYDTDAESGKTLWYYDNYIGYKYGENNLAFMLTWDKVIDEIPTSVSAEYVVSGDKSPANPWHDRDRHPGRTQLLPEDTLEHTFKLRFSATQTVGRFEFTPSLMLGYVWNKLALGWPDDPYAPQMAGEPDIFLPSDESGPLYELRLKFRYSLPIRKEWAQF